MGSSEKIILHHYTASPYSEKARLFLGYKGASWLSVITPPILPKPDLVPLTGGYRRAPVLQIGADIYCDTSLILEKLHSIFPNPPIASGRDSDTADLLEYLIGSELFVKVARYVLGSNAKRLPEDLVKDRADMHPHHPFHRENLEMDLHYLSIVLSKYLPKFDSALLNRKYFGGDLPSFADFSVYIIFWFLHTIRKLKPFIAEAEYLPDWFSRMKDFGSGNSEPLAPAEAIRIAKESEPLRIADPKIEDLGFGPEDRIHLSPDSYDHEIISGTLLHSDESRIILSSENDKVGKVHIHFPRIGYVFKKV